MKNTSIKINPLSKEDGPIKKEVGQLSLDIYHTDNEIIILAPIAGVKKEDIKIAVTDDILVIKGKRASRTDIADENYYTKECFWGDFSRSIVLPLEADSKSIAASFEDNVLEIHIPKTEQERTKIIKIAA